MNACHITNCNVKYLCNRYADLVREKAASNFIERWCAVGGTQSSPDEAALDASANMSPNLRALLVTRLERQGVDIAQMAGFFTGNGKTSAGITCCDPAGGQREVALPGVAGCDSRYPIDGARCLLPAKSVRSDSIANV